MKSGLRRRSSTKLVVVPWWERRRSGSNSSRNSLLLVRSAGTSRRAVNRKRRADRLIKHPWELKARWGCYHAAHARGAEQAMPPGPTLLYQGSGLAASPAPLARETVGARG